LGFAGDEMSVPATVFSLLLATSGTRVRRYARSVRGPPTRYIHAIQMASSPRVCIYLSTAISGVVDIMFRMQSSLLVREPTDGVGGLFEP